MRTYWHQIKVPIYYFSTSSNQIHSHKFVGKVIKIDGGSSEKNAWWGKQGSFSHLGGPKNQHEWSQGRFSYKPVSNIWYNFHWSFLSLGITLWARYLSFNTLLSILPSFFFKLLKYSIRGKLVSFGWLSLLRFSVLPVLIVSFLWNFPYSSTFFLKYKVG